MKHQKPRKPFEPGSAARQLQEKTGRRHGNLPHALASAGTASSSMPASGWQIIVAAGLIVLAAVAAYHNSFGGTLVYDDDTSIVNNPTIRQLWPIGKVLAPPTEGETVSGRPLLNLSLAVNYALGGLEVSGYHVANLAIHIAAALLLFGILRRTFLTPTLRDRFGRAATALALAGALLWTLHPLQTESVTYIVQRAESLAGLFYLLTLYCVIRGAGTVPFFVASKRTSLTTVSGEKGDCPPRRYSRLWYAAAVLACLLGAACKEILVTAPLVVLLYDRTLLAGSFAEALRRRWRLYLGLAATWILLAALTLSTGLIDRQSEAGVPDAWSYARSQPGVILHYLRLSVWPRPLCLDYAWPVANTLGEILPGAIAIGSLVAATLWALVNRRPWGMLGAWFLLILAPTSSILPLKQLAFEHRMYLPLASVAVLVVAGGYALWVRLLPGSTVSGPGAAALRWALPSCVLTVALAALGRATVARNSDYQSLLSIWQDTVTKRPGSPLAQYNLANVLSRAGRTGEAIEHYRQALCLRPDYVLAHHNLANVLARSGSSAEAIEHYMRVLRLDPGHAGADNNLGNALAASGRFPEAIAHYEEALRLKPDDAEAHNNFGIVLSSLGRTSEAIEHYQQALQLKPDDAKPHNNLGFLLDGLGRTGEAIEHYYRALQFRPRYPEAHYNLGNALARTGKTREASEHYQQALRLVPNHVGAALALAWLLATHETAEAGDPARAVQLAERARDLTRAESTRCLDALAAAYAAVGRFDDAVIAAQRAIQLAESAGQITLAQRIQSRLELYRAGRPYREGNPPAEQPKP